MKTRFFRFMLSLRKNTHHNSQEKFGFVPLMPMNRAWTDDELYEKFGLSREEQDFIATQIREMT
jgi:site-specific DNA-methyltransferase (adenine-specific)